MLGGVKLKVTFTHEKTCFAYISPKYSTNNEQTQCVQVLHRDKQIFLWVVFNSAVPEGHIACNPMYSRMVGLEEAAEVFVSPYADLKVLDELYVETDSPDDQEILEHNTELLQMRILDQLRLVVANQKTVVWISASLPIVFTPKQTGILVNHSQIIVKMDVFNSMHKFPAPTTTVPKETEHFKNIGTINKGLLAPYLNVPKKFIMRAVPIDSDGKKDLIHPYTVFIHEDFIEEKYKDLTIILSTMTNIPSIITDDEDDSYNNNIEINEVCVEIVPVDSVIFLSLCIEGHNRNIPTVLIPRPLNAILKLERGMRIIFTIIGDSIDQPEHIDIITYQADQNQSDSVIERFKQCVISSTHSGKKFLINSGLIKQNTQITTGLIQFKLKPDILKFTMLDSESFRNCTVAAKCAKDTEMLPTKAPTSSKHDYDYNNYCRSMLCVESLIEKVLFHVNFEIHREAIFKGASEIKSNVLITGQSGTGKSKLCQIIQKELTAWSIILHCRTLRGRKDIPEELAKAILYCQEHSPAVLICDDLDSLVPSNTEGASPQDIAYVQRLAVVIKQLLQTCTGVCILMTAQSMKDLHPTLRQFTGKPMFTAHFEVPELGRIERVEFFNHLLNDKLCEEFDVEVEDVFKLATDTAGCTARDMVDYLNKKIFKAVKKKKSNRNDPKPRLVEEITKDEETAKEFDIWGPVGGLEEVKQELTECIFWPIMYPALFPSQSCGILLYGPPGTGKSHIGSCLARLTNMSMITVKGPELLSKYIGQSEKAVRDIFDKADMKRPCILFFDEFDSLAPKRGHDSTGVTDRVVNQLLARMDGAEGGARGPVLAATSRPDLLDPALLRAGRLQRHVYCALPDQQGRYEVLRTLTKSMLVDEAVDLQDLAERTDGYTPADLKSILVTAQLTRLEIQLSTNEVKTVESVVVSKEDIESALAETKPSLSKQQIMFYDIIYRRFRGESLSPEQQMITKFQQKQKVTLA